MSRLTVPNPRALVTTPSLVTSDYRKRTLDCRTAQLQDHRREQETLRLKARKIRPHWTLELEPTAQVDAPNIEYEYPWATLDP